MNLFGLFKKTPHPASDPPKAMYDGAQAVRRLLNWSPANTGPKAQGASLNVLRRRASDLYRNNPIARAAIDKLVEDSVAGGIGCRPDAAIKERLRQGMVQSFEDWALDADADQSTDFYGQQAVVMREMLIAGEVLALLEPLDTSSGIRLRVRVIESDHLPLGQRDLGNGHRLIDGIELNPQGQRVAYHLYAQHPGDGQANLSDIRRIEARRVLHIYEARRPGQLRGESLLSPVLARLKNLDEFDDAVLERQKLANLFMAFIRRPAPEFDAVGAALDPLPMNLEPGAVHELLPGEDMTFAEPPHAEGYEGFTREQQRRIAAALGIPYFLLSGDYTEVNDRTARVALTAYRRRVLQLLRNTLIPRFVRPVREAWVDAAMLAGILPSNILASTLKRTHYVPEAWQYINPVQDINAEVIAINNGLKSRSESLLERGRDIESVDAQRKNDRQRARDMGLEDQAHGR